MNYYDNSVVFNDLKEIANSDVNFQKFRNTTVLITGINGMLATYLAYSLFYLNDHENLGIRVIGLGRNKKEFTKKLPNLETLNFEFVEQDVTDRINIEEKIDYIFHAATNASPESMVKQPVEISLTNTLGTYNVAEVAKKNDAHLHFFSTREVYGSNPNLQLKENDDSIVNILNVRDVYPIAKLSAESMLLAYHKEYGLDISISRIAHAYGPTMKIDGRVMSDFIGKVKENQDIILNSNGSAERAFIYVTDAISAIFYIVLNHTEQNFVMNISNELEPITVKQLALLISRCSERFSKSIEVQHDLKKSSSLGYSKNIRKPLDTSRLEKTGWSPKVLLEDGIMRTLKVVDNQ